MNGEGAPPPPVPDLPGGWPIVGHLPAFRRDPLALLRRVAAQPGPLCQLRLGPRRVVIASSPEAAEALLVRLAPALEKGPLVRRWSRPLLGEGLVACATAEHAEHRAQLAPAFSAASREAVTAGLARAAMGVLSRPLGDLAGAGADRPRALHEAAGAGEAPGYLDLAAIGRELVAAVVGPALVATLDPPAWRALFLALDAVNYHLTARIGNPLLPPIGAPTPGARRAAAALARLDDTIEALARARRAERDRLAGGSGARPADLPAGRGREPARPADLLDVLLEARQPDGAPLSAQRVRDELVTFLAASYETTATALTWTLSMLARHPQVAAAIRREAQAVTRGVPCPAAADLPALVRCEQAIKETLRLWPPVHTLGRQTREAVHLCGHTLPPGTIVAFSTYLLHRRPDLHPAPDRFDPQRFAPDRPDPAARPGRFSYLPFGAGPRACIGGDLALATLKLLVAGLTAHHDLVPARAPAFDLTPQLLVTLRPRGPLSLKFAPPPR